MSGQDPGFLLRREPDKAFRSKAHLMLGELADGEITRFLSADGRQTYLTILYALLLLRRRHELAPLHADLYDFVREAVPGRVRRHPDLFRCGAAEVRRLKDRLIPLAIDSRREMAADLKAFPLALGADVLRADLAEGGWLEQEAWEPPYGVR